MVTNIYLGFFLSFGFTCILYIAMFKIINDIRKSKLKINIKNLGTITLATTLGTIFLYSTYQEYQFMVNYKYVKGTIIGFCKTGKYDHEDGIEFEYELNGKIYRKCDKLTIDKKFIYLNTTKVQIRTTNSFPDKGRVDFNRPLE